MLFWLAQALLFFGHSHGGCECESVTAQLAFKATDTLVVTEIMQNPNAVADTEGEWFEVYNPGVTAVNMNGWTIRDNDVDSHTITTDVIVPAGGYLVLARNSNSAVNGGINAAYQYSGFLLANGADEVILVRPDATIADEVLYDGGATWPDPTGASMELTSAALDNNVGANWTEATDVLPSGDKATPGTGPDGVGFNAVITEIMQNPNAVADTNGEWFEVYNPGPGTVNLNGWTIRDNGVDNHVISGDLFIAPGAYAVLGSDANSATNGGMNVQYQYSGFLLANGADEIILVRDDATIADEVLYDGGTNWPDPTGASMELTSAALDNNLGSNWTTATTAMASGDFGTPGSGPDGGSGPGGNLPPSVNAGSDQSFVLDTASTMVNLSGTATDPEGQSMTYEWVLTGGTAANIVIDTPASLTTTVTVSGTGLYTFELRANDGELTGTDTVNVNARPEPSSNGAYTIYFGNIHAHSSYSDGNKSNDPSTAGAQYGFEYARDQGGLDWLVMADHNHASAGMSIADYPSLVAEANTVDAASPNFVAIYGTEWGTISTGGHVIYSHDQLWGWEAGNYDVFIAKGDYDALFNQIRSVGTFGSLCHPQSDHFDGIFNNPYNALWDEAVNIVAVKSGPAFSTVTDYSDPSNSLYLSYYYDLLLKGYHVGPGGDQDTHYDNWGLSNEQRTAVLAESLTRPDIMAALKAGRTYAVEDRNIVVDFTGDYNNGTYHMASTVLVPVGQTITFNVNITDPDGEATSSLNLIGAAIGDNAVSTVSSSSGGTLAYGYTPATEGEVRFFLVEVTQADGQRAWTAPIWVEATAGNSGNLAPTAGFTAAINDLAVTFTDTSSDSDGTVSSWAWNFGDGNTSSAQNPTHTYAAAGTYTVTLTVTDDQGATDTASQSVTVSTTPVNQAPTAGFTAAINDLAVTFTDTSSDSDGTVSSWSWNFGDGNTSNAQNPTHTYAAAGTYTVTLTVTDDQGATDTASQSVTVSTTPVNQAPTADFTTTINDLTVAFADASSDSDGTVSSWAWNFGDGNTSSAQNPTHTYATAGTYSVSLTVTDNQGASNVTSQSVTVTAPSGTTSSTVTGSLTGQQSEFWDVTVSGGDIVLNLTWDDNKDLDLYLYDPSGNLVASSTTTNQPEALTYATGGVTGTYTVEVYNYSRGGKTTNYSLQVTWQP